MCVLVLVFEGVFFTQRQLLNWLQCVHRKTDTHIIIHQDRHTYRHYTLTHRALQYWNWLSAQRQRPLCLSVPASCRVCVSVCVDVSSFSVFFSVFFKEEATLCYIQTHITMVSAFTVKPAAAYEHSRQSEVIAVAACLRQWRKDTKMVSRH